VPRIALTDLTIRSLRSEQRTDFWDAKTPSFGIRVGKRPKTFIVKRGGSRIALGSYPSLPLQKARQLAFAQKSKPTVNRGEAISFKFAYDAFLEIHVPTLKPRSQAAIKGTLQRHFYKPLRTKMLVDITHREVAKITDALVKTPSEAWHAFKDIRTFFKWCVPRYIPHSPMEGLKSPTRYIPRRRVLAYPEILIVWEAANDYPFGTILKLLVLTGQRWGEIASLRWDYIDEKTRTITLPDTKNGTEHCFPYGQMVADILDTIPRLNSTTLLFPGRIHDTPCNGAGKGKWQLDRECKIADWKILDLRRTFGTKLAELAVPPHIVERLLNHKLGSLQTAGVITAVAAVYNRALYIAEMREAIQKWETHLASLLARNITSAKAA
jgi:integrase